MPMPANSIEHSCSNSNLNSLEALSPSNGPLDLLSLQAQVAGWLEGQQMVGSLFSHPLADFDIYEDAEQLVNRIYYAVPKFSHISQQFRLFVFFAEATFQEDGMGDLVQVKSEFFVPEGF